MFYLLTLFSMVPFDYAKVHDKAAVIYEVLLIYCDKLAVNGIGTDSGYVNGAVAAHKVALVLFKKALPPLDLVHFKETLETLKGTLDKALVWALESFTPDTDDTFPDGFHAFAEQLAMVYSDLS